MWMNGQGEECGCGPGRECGPKRECGPIDAVSPGFNATRSTPSTRRVNCAAFFARAPRFEANRASPLARVAAALLAIAAVSATAACGGARAPSAGGLDAALSLDLATPTLAGYDAALRAGFARSASAWDLAARWPAGCDAALRLDTADDGTLAVRPGASGAFVVMRATLAPRCPDPQPTATASIAEVVFLFDAEPHMGMDGGSHGPSLQAGLDAIDQVVARAAGALDEE